MPRCSVRSGVELRHVCAAGFGLVALGQGLLVVGPALSEADLSPLAIDLVLAGLFGILMWGSLTGRMAGVNDTEPGIPLRAGVYFLLAVGLFTTGLGAWSLARTAL